MIVNDRSGNYTADEIASEAQGAGFKMSRATVYRALLVLEKQGVIYKTGRTGRGGRVVWHARSESE